MDADKKMTMKKAKLLALEILGSNGEAIADALVSSPKIRRDARGRCRDYLYAIKRNDMDDALRLRYQKLLTVDRRLSTYYRYKVGEISLEFEPFTIFTVITHGDSWVKCFEKLIRIKGDKNEKGFDDSSVFKDDA